MSSIITDKIDGFFNMFNGSIGAEEDKKNIKKKIVGIYGTQGGVGVSSFITQLACRYKQNGLKVIIIDGNFLKPYHFSKYKKQKNKLVLKDYIYNEDLELLISTIVRDKNKVEYLYTEPFPLVDILNFNENDNKYKFFRETLNKLVEFYDLILIDLDLELSHTYLEQALIKETQLFIEIQNDTLGSKLNEDICRSILSYTAAETPIVKIMNKCPEDYKNNEIKLQLPYKERFSNYELYGVCYLYSDDTTKSDYLEKFDTIIEFINANLESKN